MSLATPDNPLLFLCVVLLPDEPVADPDRVCPTGAFAVALPVDPLLFACATLAP